LHFHVLPIASRPGLGHETADAASRCAQAAPIGFNDKWYERQALRLTLGESVGMLPLEFLILPEDSRRLLKRSTDVI
jgi:hypothetical protein